MNRRLLTGLLVAYLALLAASHLKRWLDPHVIVPAEGDAVAELPVWDGERLDAGRRSPLVYIDRGPQDPAAPVVVLLHGSPGRKVDFSTVIPGLADRYRVLALDLPGFGRSGRGLPDYSARGHAAVVWELLDELGIPQAHVAGFSMGGAVALRMYEQRSQGIESLSMLAATGVQELELLGDYRVNHLVHGAQVAGLWLAHEGVPHFGLFDGGMLSLEYARNFYDTDQRPLRGLLQRFEPPLLIIHGELDPLVPVAGAYEHHRLVPQSELMLLRDGEHRSPDHFFPFIDGENTALWLGGFLDRVEAGQGLSRSDADDDRLQAAARPFDPRGVPPAGGLALFVIFLVLALATMISEDLTCIVAGILVAQGRMEFLPAVAACGFGIFVGDMLIFLAGRLVGRPALDRIPLRWWISPERVEVSSRWFDRRGPIVIGISRFLPGTRLATYFVAGMLRTRMLAFAGYFLLAVLLWTPILVALSMWIGGELLEYLAVVEKYTPLAVLAAVLLMYLLVKLVVPLFSYRGRRMLAGSIKRKIHWEFWPPWVVYPPVVLYLIWQAIRLRGPLLFTAANPAIDASGFIDESKQEILEGLAGAGEFVARHRLLSRSHGVEQRVEACRRFIDEAGLDYPVVLKPDAGQRGSGVQVVRDETALRSYLVAADYDTIIQEYAPGEEFGVFYYRYPHEERGRIFSITEKRMPVVVGDGERTVERLILDDPRAVSMASIYLAQQADQERVPAAGEEIQLVELGTHCRGAIFLDGGRLATAALEEAIDRISRGYDGFFFGRYDLRTPDPADLARGRNFKIVELNGVTSEATHIYDPAFSLFAAYRVLFKQWRVACEIGAANRKRGVAPVGFGDLIRRLRDYRQSSRNHP